MRIVLIFVCLWNSGALLAQNFPAVVSDTTIYGQPGDFTFEAGIDLINHSFGDLQLAFTNLEQGVPSGWQTSNCLGANCLPIGVTSGNFTLGLVSSDNYVIGHFYPNNVPGSGYMRIKVYEVFNPDNYIILTYFGVAGQVTSVENLQPTDLNIFPNPANDKVNLVLPNDKGYHLQARLFSMTGQLIKTFGIDQSLNVLDVSDIPSGVYLLHMGSTKKKIIIKR